MIVVATPTMQFGGLDVAFASVSRQTVAKDIIWLIADEKLKLRKHIYSELHDLGRIRAVVPFRVPTREGYPRNLTSSYNEALTIARDLDADFFVSMQDYIWIPPDGVERFASLGNSEPNALLTGLCSIADNPTPEAVVDPEGLLTIFSEPYTAEPNHSWWWSDFEVRGAGREIPSLVEIDPQQWELNWAAIGSKILATDAFFDPEYDLGIGYDHQDFAATCRRDHGSKIILDTGNQAIGLPHKAFFPEVTEANGKLTEVNRLRMEAKWNI